MHLILLIFTQVHNRTVVEDFCSGFVMVRLSKTLRVETRPRWVVWIRRSETPFSPKKVRYFRSCTMNVLRPRHGVHRAYYLCTGQLRWGGFWFPRASIESVPTWGVKNALLACSSWWRVFLRSCWTKNNFHAFVACDLSLKFSRSWLLNLKFFLISMYFGTAFVK